MRSMIRAVEIFVGLRYLRSKGRTRFVSFITAISLAGIALGVAALITILSVMNGFEAELRERLLSMTAHGYVTGTDNTLADWQQVESVLAARNDIIAVAPVIEAEGMIKTGRSLKPVLVQGVIPEAEARIAGHAVTFVDGSLDELIAGSRGIVLGRFLAIDLGVRRGDGVVLLVPRPSDNGSIQPTLERFVVRGVFEAGVQDHDASLALVHLSDAARLAGLGTRISSVRFLTPDVMQAPAIAASIELSLKSSLATRTGAEYVTSDWTVENESYFRAIRLEKMMMSLLLSLIIGVAAFNIIASLVMVVTDKTTDIAILRTLGMSPGNVIRIFFVQGAIIGWLGVFLGIAAGILLAINVPTLVPFLEQTFGFQIMPGDVYYVSAIPSILERNDVLTIGIAAFVLTSLATLYPALRAARVQPAVALRYE